MIIPPRCFTCGKVIGDKWIHFIRAVQDEKQKSDEEVESELDIEYININGEGRIKKSVEGKVLDQLKLHKYCCRRMFLGNVHLITHI
jgi:DNA-directed RNA polymerase subunit N (RpoN/RPB10)|tara:strand:+ start:11593 stop:11853 length:261 start_codon:yes stop_codon:yes gene_type:complete